MKNPPQKKIFDSSEEEQELQNSNDLFIRIGLFASTIANTVALFAMAAMFLPASLLALDGVVSYVVTTALVALCFFVSNAFDYHGIRVYGRYFMAEAMAIASRKFRTTGIGSLFLIQDGLAFAACFFVSWQLSVQGSQITSQWLTEGKIEAKAKDVAKDVKGTLNWSVSVKEKAQHRLDSLKKAKEDYIRTNTKNQELYKEYLTGAEWAATTMKPTIAAADRKFNDDIKRAEKEFDKISNNLDTATTSISTALNTSAKSSIDKEHSKAERVAMVMDLLGVWPLYLVIVLMMMQGTYKVKEQAPDDDPNQDNEPGIFHRIWNAVGGKFTEQGGGEKQTSRRSVYSEKK